MSIDLRPVRPEDVPELGRICYEAFKDISERHGFESDFATVEFAQLVAGMLVQQEDVYSLGAFDGDAPMGSNYINMWGDAAGLGPISVDLGAQGQGIGRALMQGVVEHARSRGHDMVRLCQDSFNMQSLALYASLGFEVKEPLSYLHLSDANPVDANFRPASEADFDAMDELCRAVYRISRKGEYAALLSLGFPGFVLERGGHVSGYIMGTAMGHGVRRRSMTWWRC